MANLAQILMVVADSPDQLRAVDVTRLRDECRNARIPWPAMVAWLKPHVTNPRTLADLEAPDELR